MADYPELAATLAAMNAVKGNPTENEDASKLQAAIVQTRLWTYAMLAAILDANGKLRPEATSEGSLKSGTIRGTTANESGTQREVQQGTISTPDLRDEAVSPAKIKNKSITAAQIENESIGSDVIADGGVRGSDANGGGQREILQGSVSDVDLRDDAVITAKLKDGAVATNKIADEAVTTAKIANNAVDGTKLPVGTTGQVLLHDGTKFVPMTITGGLTLTGTGVATISLTSSAASYVRISERNSAGVNGGASSAGVWTQKRGVATAWTIDQQTVAGTVSIGSGGLINIERNGLYLLFVSAPAFSVGRHKMRVHLKTSPSGSYNDFEGSSECAAPGCSTSSRIILVVTITGASSGSPAAFEIQHYTELARSVNGLGIATGDQLERYAMVELLQISNG